MSEAMDSPVVHQAVGVLMATLGVDAQAATQLLAERADQADQKVTELAKLLVDQAPRAEESMAADALPQ
jgi:hypothetical protein